jgi:uncharacterized protein
MPKSIDFIADWFIIVEGEKMNRAQKKSIVKDLEQKMVLLVGPRQVGKTWLAKEIATEFSKSLYLNYDNFKDQKIIHNQSWLMDTELLIFDEIHKMKGWKNYLKGIYDTKPDFQKILVTGSARLDVYETMGDSLAGRYFKHTLLPLSLSEIVKSEQTPDLERLIQRGGFPEPYLAEDEKESHRWRQQYVSGILSTDVFDVQSIENNKAFRLVFELIRSRVGSPISYQSIAQDVGISPHTVKRYIQILEAVYLVFKITPYATNVARSLLKEPKIYLFDSGLVEGDDGIQFENTVAVSLYKAICFELEALG